jgi:hypothetical protein
VAGKNNSWHANFYAAGLGSGGFFELSNGPQRIIVPISSCTPLVLPILSSGCESIKSGLHSGQLRSGACGRPGDFTGRLIVTQTLMKRITKSSHYLLGVILSSQNSEKIQTGESGGVTPVVGSVISIKKVESCVAPVARSV